MFTQVVLAFVLVGATLTGSDDTISQPICCLKKAYCCSVQRDCCPKSTKIEDSVAASDVAASDAVARPTFCAKRAYCCSIR